MDVRTVLEFLRQNGYSEAELALKQDINELNNNVGVGFCDFDKFVFPLPPVKLPVRVNGSGSGSGSGVDLSEDDDEEFKSLKSSTSATASGTADASSSDFSNPYGRHSATQAGSDTSSDRLSQFGTAREYQDFEMQTDLWYDDKDDGPYMTPNFSALDPLSYPIEDKFVMSSETGSLSRNPFSFNHLSEESGEPDHSLDYPFHPHRSSTDTTEDGQVKDRYHLNQKVCPEAGVKWDLGRTGYSDGEDLDSNLKEAILELETRIARQKISNSDPDLKVVIEKDSLEESDGSKNLYEVPQQDDEFDYSQEIDGNNMVINSSEEPDTVTGEQEGAILDEIPYWDGNEDQYEVFNLRVIHRKNKTGFEESKEFPIVLNTIIAGRYFVTEYLGSAAFSKVVQAQDIQTGVDVCLKIIKNDKDFFDQSLDEIKLLKYVNKHDPADEHHIIRLYDYFYHQEHLFIVCELLRANLYEFQKFNLESGGEPYFTMGRLQAIARQCLEALDYLHSLGIIHCDLKPENVLIKSYRNCQIKVIDLGSSCFQTDNLCLYVQSRSYRAPEVMLGLPYGPKIDIWSLGCIMAELCSGEVLFPNDAVVMLLGRMIGLLGPIDLEMLLRGQETDKYFTKEYDLYHINEDTNETEYIIPEKSSLEHHLPVTDAGFLDFLRYLLQINPRGRPMAKEALQHPWLSVSY